MTAASFRNAGWCGDLGALCARRPATAASGVLCRKVCRRSDGFYPLVSLAAFLSGGCFGFYAAWRGYAERRAQIRALPQKRREWSEVDSWAA
jgi:hypothetical protein